MSNSLDRLKFFNELEQCSSSMETVVSSSEGVSHCLLFAFP